MTRLLALLAAALLCATAHAQPGSGMPWRKTPQIVVIAKDGDPRLPLVDEAIAYWNRTLEESGAALRLPIPTRADVPIPERELQEVSDAVIKRRPVVIPQSLHELPGDLAIVLAQSPFVSFASPPYGDGKRVIGIRGKGSWLNLPNVMRNVIAHELGHAVGLRHNADPTLLMCGRPAPCDPFIYQSDTARFFPLADEERAALRRMYPPP